MNHVLVICGSMGSGKTTVLGEASDLLERAGIAVAAIDLDDLGIWFLPGAGTDDLTMRNFAAVCENYSGAGIERLLIAEAVVDRARIAKVVGDASIVVCRLRASLATMQQRVRLREPGLEQDALVERVAVLEAELDAAAGEDFSVGNDGRNITEVAREILARAGWL